MTAIPVPIGGGGGGIERVGTTLYRATLNEVYYSAWEHTQTEAATFACSLIAKSSTTHLEVKVQTKNEGDASATDKATISFTTETPPDVKNARATDLKELFRYEVTVKNAGGFTTSRMLVPTWERR